MVTESPFNKTRPTRVLCFAPPACFTSSQSSKTRFMYSSKPTICPSRTSPFAACSYSQICTLLFVCRKRKMRLIGCVIMRWTFVAMMTDCVCIYAFTLLDVIRSVRLISPARWDENNDALFSRTSIDARAIEDRDGRDIKLSLSFSLRVLLSSKRRAPLSVFTKSILHALEKSEVSKRRRDLTFPPEQRRAYAKHTSRAHHRAEERQQTLWVAVVTEARKYPPV